MNPENKTSKLRLGHIREVLKTERMTAIQLAAELHITKRWTLPYISYLHEQGEIYIAGWRLKWNGPPAAIYAIGNRPDRPRPAPPTQAEKCRAYRRRKRNDQEWQIAQMMRVRAKRLKPRMDPLVAALFGARGNDVSHG